MSGRAASGSADLRPAALVVAAVTLVSTVAVVATDADLSASRFLHDDVLVRGAPDAEPVLYRYLDASPWSIWVPNDHHVRASWRRGEIADWDRTQGGGYSPLLGFQNGIFSPFRLLTALFPARCATGLMMLWTAALMFLGGVWFGTRLGLSPLAASVGSAALPGSPMMMGMWGFDYGLVLLFIPWLSGLALDAVRNPSFATAARLGLCSGLSFTSGHPSMIFLTHLIAGLVVVSEVLVTRRARGLAAPAAGIGLGLLLAAPMLVPFLELLTTGWSYKTASADAAGFEAFTWAGWSEALQALLLGTDDPMVDHVRFYAYLGPALLAFAGLGLAAAVRRPTLRFVLPLFALAFAVSLPPPPLGWLTHVPVLGHLKLWYIYPAFVFAVGTAAAIGVQAVLDRVEKASLQAVIGGAVALFALTQGPIRAGDLHAPRFGPPWPSSEATRWLGAQAGPYRVMSLGGQVNGPNTSNLTGIEDLGLTQPLYNARYDAFFLGVDPKARANSFGTLRITGRIDAAYLGRFNVRYLLNGKVPFGLLHSQMHPQDPFGPIPPRRVRHPGWPLVYEDAFVQIFENRLSYRPRAHLSAAAVAVPDLEAAVAHMQANPQGPDAVETTDAALIAALATTSTAAGRVDPVRYPSDDEVEVQVDLRQAALLVVADSFDAGWTATLDGAPAPLLPVNALARGVWVPAGAHIVRMRYDPPGLAAGGLVSALTGLLLGLGWRRSRSRSRRPS